MDGNTHTVCLHRVLCAECRADENTQSRQKQHHFTVATGTRLLIYDFT